VADYRTRVVDAVLDARLKAVGCAVLEGPKAVGKTATAARRAASEVRLDTDVNAREIARADPSLILEGSAADRRVADRAGHLEPRPSRRGRHRQAGPVQCRFTRVTGPEEQCRKATS
jgi:hypothetical protein